VPAPELIVAPEVANHSPELLASKSGWVVVSPMSAAVSVIEFTSPDGSLLF
jgi:hypothetical protein